MDNIQKAKKKDADAFIALMQSHMQSMYKIARAILKSDEDVADAIQETILSCWEKLDQLKESRYFKTWMIRILINKCNNIWNEKIRYVPDDSLPERTACDTDFEHAEWNLVIDSLNERYRLIILLYYVEGSWIFDWTLHGDESIYTAECDEKIGDTGATVTKAEISPISIKAVLEMPRREKTEKPPFLTGVKLVDGTILPFIYMGPGTMGYVDEVSDTYEVRYAIDRILDVDQVKSLLFVKSYPEGEETYTEDHFHVIDIR